jgi:hypothetical protein
MNSHNHHYEFRMAMKFLELCSRVWFACSRLAEAEPAQRNALGEFELLIDGLDALRQVMTLCISDDNKSARGILHSAHVAIDKARVQVWNWKNQERG